MQVTVQSPGRSGALRTVRAEAGMSPQDPMAQGSLSVIVGGLDTWFAYEGPQGGLDIEALSVMDLLSELDDVTEEWLEDQDTWVFWN